MRCRSLIVCVMVALILGCVGTVHAFTFTVDAQFVYDNVLRNHVYGTFEYDGGTAYSNWHLTSYWSTLPEIVYNELNSDMADYSKFNQATNIGPTDFFLHAPAAPTEYGELWIHFSTPLTELAAGESATLPAGWPYGGGTYDSRKIVGQNQVAYAPLTGTVTREGDVPEIPEPASLVLVSVSLGLMGLIRKHRRS